MITAKKDTARLLENGKFISFVKEGYDLDTEIFFYVEDIDFNEEPYCYIPLHKCIKCSQEEWEDLLKIK